MVKNKDWKFERPNFRKRLCNSFSNSLHRCYGYCRLYSRWNSWRLLYTRNQISSRPYYHPCYDLYFGQRLRLFSYSSFLFRREHNATCKAFAATDDRDCSGKHFAHWFNPYLLCWCQFSMGQENTSS